MAENEGGTTVAAPVDNSPSLTSVIGEMYGDYRDAEPETDAGAPPAGSSENQSSADDSEGTAASAPAGTPPAEADPSGVPDTSTPPEPDLDPFEGSAPLAYTVDGESRTYDGITVLKDGGAIIDPGALERVQRVFGERDHLYEQGQQRHAQYSALERATTWQTKDAQGQPVTLTGQPALMEQRAVMARSLATLNVMTNALKDPDTLASLIAGVDENNRIVLDPRGVSMLETMAENAAIKAESRARAHLSSLSAPPPPVEAPVESLAAVTIDAIAKANTITLSDADKQWAASHFPRYVTTTKDGRAVDPQFVELLKDRAQMRAEQTKTVAAASTAGASNAARLAAASIGKGGKVQPPRITPTKTPEPSRADDFDSLWDRQEKAAAGALKAHAIGH